jgi:hypothetical protein
MEDGINEDLLFNVINEGLTAMKIVYPPLGSSHVEVPDWHKRYKFALLALRLCGKAHE